MTTPAGWYPDPSGKPMQRYFDGTEWTENYAAAGTPPAPAYPVAAYPSTAYPTANSATPTSPVSKARVLAVVGAAVVGLVVMIALNGIGETKKRDLEQREAASRPTTAALPNTSGGLFTNVPVPASPTAAPAGSEVRDGKFAFRVVGMRRSDVAGDPSNPFMTVNAQGEFIILTVNVANIGNEPQSYFGSNQKLIDASSREYEINSEASLWMTSMTGDINPGNAIQVAMPFDVPPGTVPKELELHDSMFSGGVRLKV